MGSAGAVDAAAAKGAKAGGACAGRVDAITAGDATLPSQPSLSQLTAAAAAVDAARSVGIGAWRQSQCSLWAETSLLHHLLPTFALSLPLSVPIRLSCIRFSVSTA